jgi:hypothetical protein
MLVIASLAFGCSTLIGLDDPLGFSPPVSSDSSSGGNPDGNTINPNNDAKVDDDGSSSGGDGSPFTDGSLSDAQDAGDGAPPVCNGTPACDRVVFVTSQPFPGNLLGLPGADTKCQSVAAGIGAHPRVKDRQFRAWLSNSVTAAKDRIAIGTGKYILPSGTLVANNRADLLDGTLANPIIQTETGALIAGATAWTASTFSGDLVAAHCSNWSLSLVGQNGRVGDTTAVSSAWTNSANKQCSVPQHLYCIEF